MVAAVAVLAAVSPAIASPITYDFSVTATNGPLTGQSSSGSFSFDSSSITLGAQNIAAGLLTAVNFTWDGITYTSATANTGLSAFDSSGNLTRALFGNNCSAAGSCAVFSSSEVWYVSAGAYAQFAYSQTNFNGVAFGDNKSFNLVGVPEPLTLSLFGAGFVGVVAVRRRRKAEKAA